jgi:hypothetical protein
MWNSRKEGPADEARPVELGDPPRGDNGEEGIRPWRSSAA